MKRVSSGWPDIVVVRSRKHENAEGGVMGGLKRRVSLCSVEKEEGLGELGLKSSEV